MIDVNSGEEKLHINLDVTLPKCPCDILSLDIVDVTGVHVVDIEGKLHKHRPADCLKASIPKHQRKL